MFDLLNIFETFIPQLLRYPNPADPLNGQAAQLLLKDEIRYNARVREYVKLYAHNDACSSTPAVVVPSSRQNEPINTSDVCSSLVLTFNLFFVTSTSNVECSKRFIIPFYGIVFFFFFMHL